MSHLYNPSEFFETPAETFTEGDRVEMAFGKDSLPGRYIVATADGRHVCYGGWGEQASDRIYIVGQVTKP